MNFLTNVLATEWILNLALQSFVLFAAGWVLIYLLRNRAAPLRSGISLTAIVMVLFLIPLFFIAIALAGLPFHTTFNINLNQPIFIIDQGDVPSLNHGDANVSTVPALHNPFGFSISSIGQKNFFFVQIINFFGIIWLAGCIVQIFRFWLAVASVQALKKHSRPIRDRRILGILKEVSRSLSIAKKIRIHFSPQIPYPMTAGIFKPFIFLPEDLLEKLTDNQFRGVLMHEASHIRHWDQAAGILQRLAKAIFWWNHLAYALSKTHARAREEISDNHVLLLSDSREYAECLIDLAEKTSRFKHAAATVGMGAPHIPLKSRIKYILSREKKMETRLKKSTTAMILLAALLVTVGITGSRITLASDVTAPKLIKRVEPVYPQEAKQAGIEGTVVIAARTDSRGIVTRLDILKGAHEALNQAAANAVIQWKYQPMMIDETAYGIAFTVTCRFLNDKEKPEIQISHGIAEGITGGVLGEVESGVSGEVQGGVVGGVMGGVMGEVDPKRAGLVDEIAPVRATGDIKPPKLIKMVEPVYPEAARRAQVEGLVILEAATDKYGRVQSARVLRPLSPALNQAAIEAVKQWIYEPAVIDGEPRGVTFTITVNFKLDKPQPETDIESVTEERPPFEPVRAVGGIKPPVLIKRVDPVYPEEAEEQRIEGSVILEVTTNPYGRVHDVKILRSIPALDQAAIDAVKQWVYAPKTIDGESRGMIFTVTVMFRLKK